MTQHKNPRRQVLALIKVARDRLTNVRNGWDIQLRTYDTQTRGWRDLRETEKPENQAERWRRTWAELDLVARAVQDAQIYAAAQYHAALARQQSEVK